MIPLETLARWALNELQDDELDAVEAHLLGCDECTRTAERLLSIPRGVRAVIRGGAMMLRGHPAVVAKAAEEGLITRRYRLLPESTSGCTVSVGDVYSLFEYEVDPQDATRLDMVWRFPGLPPGRLTGVPYDPARRSVAMMYAAKDLLKTPAVQFVTEVIGVHPDREEVLGTYSLIHTPPPAG